MFVNIKTIIIASFVYLLMNTHAQAYLDPGTGSIILQAIAAAFAATAATASYYWDKVKGLYVKIFKRKKINKD
jgi:hypothetical protein|tara:strand:+ start:251 stop:469 length:219 start_codon:yes stop_codon:yes gene_type:complete